MLKIIRKLLNRKTTDFKSLVSNGAVIIDVRSKDEFKTGHIKGAVNVPVEQVKDKIGELKKLNKPLITCCKSGMRSAMAASMLTAGGIEAYNGGSWYVLKGKI
jgi:rhodanese-related sulfurtransferase